jgi:hypothetical protein
MSVAAIAPVSLTNVASASGVGSATAIASDPTTTIIPCGGNQDEKPLAAADIQRIINEALGASSPVDDLNHDGSVNVVDIQIVLNSALGLGCWGS